MSRCDPRLSATQFFDERRVDKSAVKNFESKRNRNQRKNSHFLVAHAFFPQLKIKN